MMWSSARCARRPVPSVLGLVFALNVLAIGSAYAQSAQGIPAELIRYADMILVNGQVVTVDSDEPQKMTVAEAVAVREGKILKIGTTAAIRLFTGPNTKVVDLKGRSLLPAAVYSDADNAVPGGDVAKEAQWRGWVRTDMRRLLRAEGKLRGATVAMILDKVRRIVLQAYPGETVYVFAQKLGLPGMFKLTKKDLDKLAPNQPLGLWLGSSHGIVNSKLLKIAFDKGLPRSHLHVIKDKNGEPTGQLGQQAIGFIGYHLRPWPTKKWHDTVAIPEAQIMMLQYARAGVATATGHMSGLTTTILNRLHHRGEMAIRVYPAHDFIRQNIHADQYLRRIGNLVDFALVDKTRGPMVKIIATAVGPHSGAPNTALSLLTIEPKIKLIEGLGESRHGYDKWSAQIWTGKATKDLTKEELKDTDYYTILLARQHGWNLSGIHNMGSAAIRLAMNAIEEAEAQKGKYVTERFKPSGLDHNIDWLPELLPQAKRLSSYLGFSIATRNVFKQRGFRARGLKNVLSLQYGEKRVAGMAPIKTLIEAGIKINIEGSKPDFKRAPIRWPMWYVEKAVTQVDIRGRVLDPNERIDRKTALTLITRWSARYIGEEKSIGSIAPGMYADMVVMNGNFLKQPANELAQLRPLLTLVGGVPSYVDPNFATETGLSSPFKKPRIPAEKVETALLKVMRRAIVFTGADGAEVTARLSSKRTKIRIAGRKVARRLLKAGMNCSIEYTPGKRTEASSVDCK